MMPLPGRLEATSEVIDGVVVVRVSGRDLVDQSDRYAFLRTLLIKKYQARISEAGTASCVVIIEAETEFEGAALFRALMGVWNLVTDQDARIAIVGYPRETAGGPAALPPLLPNLGLARNLACALEWIRRLQHEIAGGDHWPSVPGVTYGRSFLPGEKLLGEWEVFGSESS